MIPEPGCAPAPHDRPTTPLQAQLREEGIVPPDDDLLHQLRRPQVAIEAGYAEHGPVCEPAPEVSGEHYGGWPAVFQWEIDPADPSLESVETQVVLGDWEYDIWCQVHPAELVYASIQALSVGSVEEFERRHPLGRNVVVNLVYDRRRSAIVAIYGTARDFRPFVEAFRRGLELQQPTRENR